MKHFRKIWTKEMHEWMLSVREIPRQESYKMFLEKFPEANDVTFTAYCNERSRIGAISEKMKNTVHHGSRSPKPLFSEHEKKGFILIKVAQPSEWMFKQHWVWWQNTGHRPIAKTEMVVFLDGDNRNFSFKNLLLIPRAVAGILNNPHMNLGIIKGNPEQSRINCMRAILEYEMRKKGRKVGLVNRQGSFKDEINRKARAYNANKSEEQKEKDKEVRTKYYEKLKADPERFEEFKRKRREYSRNYMKKRRNERKKQNLK